MDVLPYALVAIVALIPLRRLLVSRKTGPAADDAKAEPSIEARNAARRRVVEEAERLCSLEDELARIAEGSGSGVPDARARAEQVRAEAIRLRAELEAACARYRLPIRLALGRRRRAPSFPSAPHASP